MKYCQLIEYNLRNIFLEKSCKKCGGETITRPLKNQKIKIGHILWINSLTFYTFCFYCMLSKGLSKYIDTKLQTSYKKF